MSGSVVFPDRVVSSAAPLPARVASPRAGTGRWIEEYDPTIMDVYRKSYKTKKGGEISIELLDTAGREEFFTLASLYNEELFPCVLFCYSISATWSIQDTLKQVEALRTNTKKLAMPHTIAVGCKSDLQEKREVPTEEARKLFAEKGVREHFECSAKDDVGCNELMARITEIVEQWRPPAVSTPKKSGGGCLLL